MKSKIKYTLLLISLVGILFDFSLTLYAKGKNIKMNFNDVEVLNFIKIIGKETGQTFVFNNNILKGKRITLISTEEFSSDEAYQIFEAVLNINGLATIDEGGITRIIDIKAAKNSSAPIYHGESSTPRGSYITRVLQVKNLNTRVLRAKLTPLFSKDAIILEVDEANVLIIRDSKENTERLADIIDIIDKPEIAPPSFNLELLQLNHANSTETANLVNRIFTSPTIMKDKNATPNLSVYADDRTNQLILVGNPVSLNKIKQLVQRLDNEIETDEGNIRVYSLKNANAKQIAEVLQKLATTMQGAKNTKEKANLATIIPDVPSNSLVVFADQPDFPTIESVINKLDLQRAQVFIQALIMEVRLDKSLEVGVDWQAGGIGSINGQKVYGSLGGIGSTGQPQTLAQVLAGGSDGTVLGIMGDTISFGGEEFSSFNAFIKALDQDTQIDILSKPQILTLNNQEAEIKVGEIIPTISSTEKDSNNNITQNIEYKEVGISLKITPQVNADDSIELQIDETSSHVIEGKVGAYDQGAITTLNRALKTRVIIDNGRTIVLGGLISDEITDVDTKTPCLGDIPGLGWLFKSDSTGTKKTNLLIFLTPTVVRDQEQLDQVTKDAQSKSNSAREGRFRIDVTNEFKVDANRIEQKETEEPSE